MAHSEAQPTDITSPRGRSAGRLLGFGVLVLICAPAARAEASYPLTFPARADALESGAYFRSYGHTSEDYGNNGWSIDFHAAKWNGSAWKRDDVGGENTDAYIFGAPLFAPEDGEVIACWRTAPDKPAPNLNYDLDGDGVYGEANNCMLSGAQCCPAGDEDCVKFPDCDGFDECVKGHDASPLGAGNHLVIRNADGDYITLFAHLQADSIPTALCPLPADRDVWDTTSSPGWLLAGADGWPDDDTDNCDEQLNGYYEGTILSTPVAVEKGEFLGRVGHSGRSSGPHLHIHVKPHFLDGDGDYCEGPSEEILFYESWAQVCESDQALTNSWLALDGDNPLEAWDLGGDCTSDADCVGDEVCKSGTCMLAKPPYCFYPDPIGRQEDHEDYGVPATNLHFTTHPDGDVLVYQSGGELRLRSYEVASDGTIVDQDVEIEGAVEDVAVARPNDYRHVIVSIRGSNGKLKHIPYMVSTLSGGIVRWSGNELSEGSVYQVESTPSPAHDGFVAAIEDGGGNLKVIDYHVDGSLEISRDYSSSGAGGPIDDVAITTMGVFEGVVTAEISSTGWLVLRSFSVPAAGGVTAVDSYPAWLSGSSVTVDHVVTGSDIVVTSLIQGDQTLRMDTWRIEVDGTIDWIDTISGGTLSEHDVTAGSSIAGDITVAVRDSNDEFRMIGYDVDWFGQIRRNSTHDLGPVTQTAIVASLAGGGEHLVAAQTDEWGDLHLFSYAENFHLWF